MKTLFWTICVIVLGLYGCRSENVIDEWADYADTRIGVIDTRANNCVIGPRLPYGNVSSK